MVSNNLRTDEIWAAPRRDDGRSFPCGKDGDARPFKHVAALLHSHFGAHLLNHGETQPQYFKSMIYTNRSACFKSALARVTGKLPDMGILFQTFG